MNTTRASLPPTRWKARLMWPISALLTALCSGLLMFSSGCYLTAPVELPNTDCIGCHRPQYLAVKSPDHVLRKFSENCQLCHSQESWRPALFHHDDVYPLVEAHERLACDRCHTGHQYKGAPRTCYGCHQQDYERTASPNHVTLSYAKTCTDCHSQTNWKTTSFDHDRFFKLEGKHKGLDCTQCHKSNVYKGTPRTCVGCHQETYEQTKEPNHPLASYPTTCADCHTQDTWRPSPTFDHEPHFPLNRGDHSRYRYSCSSCHKDQSDFKKFECIQCHEHNQREMDDEHSDIRGYSYTSANCLRCHPRGQE